ncbi:MAG TPA: hypothetical protein PLH37_00650 [bacterium]|nr:hypothetical protein [bacterium]
MKKNGFITKQKDLQKAMTLKDLGDFTESVLLPSIQEMHDSIEKRIDEKMEIKFNDFNIRFTKKLTTGLEDLEAKLTTRMANNSEDLEARLITRLVTKDYLDKKLSDLEAKIMDRTLKEKQSIKDSIILIMGILRKGKNPTKKQIESLNFLEQKLNAF